MDQRADLQQLGQAVIDLLAAELQAGGFELLDVRLFRGGGRLQVRIYVDTADGITLDGCAEASRTAGMLLEEADLFPGRYVIEVSSPGIRRPLRTRAHFEAAVGQRIDLKVAGRDGEKARRLAGRLLRIEGDSLVIEPRQRSASEGDEAGENLRIELERILEANLDPDFDAQALINADRRRRKESKRRERSERTGGRRRSRTPQEGQVTGSGPDNPLPPKGRS